MKALVKKHAEEGLWLEDVPIPVVGGNDVLIKVHKTAICGTDVHIYNWDDWAQKTIKTPMTAGHEYAARATLCAAVAATASRDVCICVPTPKESALTVTAHSPSTW